MSIKRLKYGMVGGGGGAFIGDCHRLGAQLNGTTELVAGCFSRNPEKNRKTAEEWALPDPSRIYSSYQEMAEKEAAREDGIDFVTIVTPNDSHYAVAKCFMEKGIHVMCDKPLTITVEEAEELKKIAEEKDIVFGLTYTYTGYPVIRQAREMIREGAIGDIIHVKVGHPEDWVIESVPQEPTEDLPWRFSPEKVGAALCTGDVGTHAEQLLVQFTGLRIKRVIAMMDTFPRYLPLETNTTCLLDLGDGITGDLWASQIAIGKGCDAYIYVTGSKGSLEWRHMDPDVLVYTPLHGPIQRLEAGREYMKEASNRLSRVSVAHHIGFYEAFGNIYKSFSEVLLAKKEGRPCEDYTFPTIQDGLDGVKFVNACVESQKKGNIWVSL